MAKTPVTRLLAFASVIVAAQPAGAQYRFNATIGYFTIRGEEARGDEDVLNENGSS
jgi:hypothetical protein